MSSNITKRILIPSIISETKIWRIKLFMIFNLVYLAVIYTTIIENMIYIKDIISGINFTPQDNVEGSSFL